MAQNLNAQIRKKINSFAWTWIGLLIFIGIMSLFSIWSMNRAYNDGAKKAFNTSQLGNEVLAAEIDFKIQVQEWKNILLRGKNREDRVKYFSSFEEKESHVIQHLNEAEKICSTLNLGELCSPIATTRSEHQALGKIYRQNLNHGSLENYEGIHKIDQNVRGIDRKVEVHMDELFESFNAIEKKQDHATKLAVENRYSILRKFTLIILFLALIISGMSLYSVLRSTKN